MLLSKKLYSLHKDTISRTLSQSFQIKTTLTSFTNQLSENSFVDWHNQPKK